MTLVRTTLVAPLLLLLLPPLLLPPPPLLPAVTNQVKATVCCVPEKVADAMTL